MLAFEEETLAERLVDLKTFRPKPRHPEVDAVGDRVAEFLRAL